MAKTGRFFDGFWPKSVVDWTVFALVAIFRETGVGKRVWLFLLWRRDLEKENEFWLLLVLKNASVSDDDVPTIVYKQGQKDQLT